MQLAHSSGKGKRPHRTHVDLRIVFLDVYVVCVLRWRSVMPDVRLAISLAGLR